MTLNEIIDLFKRMEKGEEGQLIGFHLHKPIQEALQFHYGVSNEKRFSDFLEDLQEHEKT